MRARGAMRAVVVLSTALLAARAENGTADGTDSITSEPPPATPVPVVDECAVLDAAGLGPCGVYQLCADPDMAVDALRDYTCACNETSVPVVGKPAECVYAHLRVVLYLPVPTSSLLGGFDARVRERLAEVLAVTPSAVHYVTLADQPTPTATAEIYMPAVTLGALKARLDQEVQRPGGILIAGVQVVRASSSIVADDTKDECDTAPCGHDQHCADPSLTSIGDFVCSCVDAATDSRFYPHVGGPSPSCGVRHNTAADVLEVLALCNGHTQMLGYSNALLHATACNAPALDPPPVLHPTRLSVSGSSLAGCSIANTSLFLGTLLFQHLLATVLGFSTRLPEQLVREAVGHPHVPIRMFVLLLPGALYCSIGLISSGEGEWAVVLGSAILCFWFLCGSLGVFTTSVELVTGALGQHVWQDGRWKRVATFKREHLTSTALVLIILATNIPHRASLAESCAGQRLLAAIVMFFYGVITAILQPYAFRAVNACLLLVILLQCLGYLLIALGLLQGDGQAGHSLVDSADTLRLVSAVFLFLFMIVAVVYRVGRHGVAGYTGRPREGSVTLAAAPHVPPAGDDGGGGVCSLDASMVDRRFQASPAGARRSLSPHAPYHPHVDGTPFPVVPSSPYREGRDSIKPLRYNPLPVFLSFVRGDASPPNTLYAIAIGDAAWLFLALSVVAHWACLFGTALCLTLYWHLYREHVLPHHPEHDAWLGYWGRAGGGPLAGRAPIGDVSAGGGFTPGHRGVAEGHPLATPATGAGDDYVVGIDGDMHAHPARSAKSAAGAPAAAARPSTPVFRGGAGREAGPQYSPPKLHDVKQRTQQDLGLSYSSMQAERKPPTSPVDAYPGGGDPQASPMQPLRRGGAKPGGPGGTLDDDTWTRDVSPQLVPIASGGPHSLTQGRRKVGATPQKNPTSPPMQHMGAADPAVHVGPSPSRYPLQGHVAWQHNDGQNSSGSDLI